MQETLHRICFGSLLCLGLFGCEAELQLGAVEVELNKPIRRDDQYQAMTSHDTNILLFGSAGVVLSSANNGETWQRNIVDKNANFISADHCSDGTTVALSFDKRVWLSKDAVAWHSHDIDTSEYLQKIVCAPDNSLWLTASFSTLLHSKDKGETWLEQSMNEDALLTHVQFFDHNVGVAAGEFGFFFTTDDGGTTWNSGGSIGEEFYPIDVWFRDQKNGWAVGLNGVVYHTSDGGQTWTRQYTQELSSPLYRVVGNDKQVFALGDQGTVITLKGNQWVPVATQKTPVHFNNGFIVSNENLLVIAGGWGSIARIEIPES